MKLAGNLYVHVWFFALRIYQIKNNETSVIGIANHSTLYKTNKNGSAKGVISNIKIKAVKKCLKAEGVDCMILYTKSFIKNLLPQI